MKIAMYGYGVVFGVCLMSLYYKGFNIFPAVIMIGSVLFLLDEIKEVQQ